MAVLQTERRGVMKLLAVVDDVVLLCLLFPLQSFYTNIFCPCAQIYAQ